MPHSVATVEVEQCGRCEAMKLRFRREEQCVLFAAVRWTPSVCDHTKGEIFCVTGLQRSCGACVHVKKENRAFWKTMT